MCVFYLLHFMKQRTKEERREKTLLVFYRRLGEGESFLLLLVTALNLNVQSGSWLYLKHVNQCRWSIEVAVLKLPETKRYACDLYQVGLVLSIWEDWLIFIGSICTTGAIFYLKLAVCIYEVTLYYNHILCIWYCWLRRSFFFFKFFSMSMIIRFKSMTSYKLSKYLIISRFLVVCFILKLFALWITTQFWVELIK